MEQKLLNMKNIALRGIMVAMISLFSIAAFAGNYSYKGTSKTKAMGKEEVQDNLVLHITETSDGVKFSLSGYEIFGVKNISITGTAVLDDKGQVVSWDKIVIKGAPGKIKDISGTLGKTNADIKMSGKSGVVGFDIRYTAKKQ